MTGSYARTELLNDVFNALLVTVLMYSAVELLRPGMVSSYVSLFQLLALTALVGTVLMLHPRTPRRRFYLAIVLMSLATGGIVGVVTAGPFTLQLLLGLVTALLLAALSVSLDV